MAVSRKLANAFYTILIAGLIKIGDGFCCIIKTEFGLQNSERKASGE